MNHLVKLGLDIYKGTIAATNYSAVDAQDALRKELMELAGMQDGKFDRRLFRKNKAEIFTIIEETLEVLVSEGIKDMFSDFAEVRNLKLGDKNEFKTEPHQILRVSKVAPGTQNFRRQRLRDGQTFSVEPARYSVAVYEELERFLAGRIDWVALVNKVAEAFAHQLSQDVYDAIHDVYTKIPALYQYSGAFNLDELTTIAARVKAKTGRGVFVLGTGKALAKVTPAVVSEKMKDELNATGRYGVVAGLELREIPQVLAAGTDEFAIDEDFLLVLPEGYEKFVKIINEGDAEIQEDEGHNAGLTKEYSFAQRFGVEVIIAGCFGYIALT